MLMQLIKYFASDGDLTKPQPSEDVSGSPRKQSNEQELITVEPQGFSKLSDSQHEHVNEMIGEAMKESTIVEEYFFSDDDLPPTGTKTVLLSRRTSHTSTSRAQSKAPASSYQRTG
ncbi:unnamed protein product [Acanthoscelides obtectus]|uniref:Uncharacterized protein n=1 Tax=Acanthoscelides obtectus TaxID=200917 RepID=A0A9P0MGB3_ACAOB|nr:unnamed protein product [Acanthoscelides obtectus]CAK1657478.1 hypothetical protein AOBTE_LOCUS20358 [Acanthoscelides obtectus]